MNEKPPNAVELTVPPGVITGGPLGAARKKATSSAREFADEKLMSMWMCRVPGEEGQSGRVSASDVVETVMPPNWALAASCLPSQSKKVRTVRALVASQSSHPGRYFVSPWLASIKDAAAGTYINILIHVCSKCSSAEQVHPPIDRTGA